MKRLLFLILLLIIPFSTFGQGRLQLTWNPSTDNVGVVGYVIWIDGERHDSTEITTYEFYFEAGIYLLTVSAYDAAKNESEQSIPLQVTIPDITVPDIPNLLAVNYLERAANIFWQESNDNVGVVGYKIFVDGIFIDSTDTNEYKIENLIPDKEYQVSISAYDNAGNESQKTSEFLVKIPVIKIPVDKITMMIYPNPSHGYFKILLKNGEIKNNSSIQIIGLDGRILYQRKLDYGIITPYEEEFELTNILKSGMYVVILFMENKRILYSYITVVKTRIYSTKYIIEENNFSDVSKTVIINGWQQKK